MGYALDNAGQQARERFGALEECYDAASRAGLARTGIGPGWRCLEVGAGAGSVALWLAETVGPTGNVLATDIDPGRIDPEAYRRGNLTVARHDIVRDPLPGNGFDLIHARLVLLHLPQRLAVLDRLIGALAPGGWLVLDEFDCEWTPVLRAGDPGQIDLYEKVHGRFLDVLTNAGADVSWGRRVFHALSSAGLDEVSATVHAQAWPGGGRGTELHRANTEQLAAELIGSGLTEPELGDFWKLLDDPGFAVQSYPLITASGRRGPAIPGSV